MITSTFYGQLKFEETVNSSSEEVFCFVRVNDHLTLKCLIPVIELGGLNDNDLVRIEGYIKIEGFGDLETRLHTYFNVLTIEKVETISIEQMDNYCMIDGAIAKNMKLNIQGHTGTVLLSFVTLYRDKDKIDIPVHCKSKDRIARILSKIKKYTHIKLGGYLESLGGPVLLRVMDILEVNNKPFTSFNDLSEDVIYVANTFKKVQETQKEMRAETLTPLSEAESVEEPVLAEISN